MQKTALILGARGRFGLAAARAFCEAGWRVVGQTRPGAPIPAEVANDARLQWLGVDLHDVQAIAVAARGASLVVHALNPAYTDNAWRGLALPMMNSAIAITRALQATLMLPGNVYNFGADMPDVLREDTPQTTRTIKGQIRIDMEQRLARSDVRGIVIRAGDFFGSGRGTWFDSTIVKNIHKGALTYPGPREISTPWAYLPDLACAFVAVAAQGAKLQPFEVFHFAGRQVTAQQWLDTLTPVAIAQGWVNPGSQLKLNGLPWPIIRLGALVNPTWRALLEMRYLWETPHRLANCKLTALIGPEPHTPLPQAARLALAELGLINPIYESAPVDARQVPPADEALAEARVSKFSPVQR